MQETVVDFVHCISQQQWFLLTVLCLLLPALAPPPASAQGWPESSQPAGPEAAATVSEEAVVPAVTKCFTHSDIFIKSRLGSD